MPPAADVTLRPARPVVVTATALTGVVAAFQLALAAGAPWGGAAWGGANLGVLPPGLRAASATSAVVHGLLAATTATPLVPARARRRVLALASGTMVVGTLLNLASPSPVERVLWTPVAAALAVLLALSRGPRPR
ncbi:hypothetical protein [Kineococcus sp. SYSU DK006]|uniref:hypothetical protein n=1 Tax=Kineococcus sp. SYSU DK006 TaxID=3383127 RepID=UPI003D7CF9E9